MRDYDPTTGRYIQADPLGLVDGASVYGYALQNPGRYVDPRGELAQVLIPAVGMGIGLIIWLYLVQTTDFCQIDFGVDLPPNAVASSFPPGYWPANKGAAEWGRRNGFGTREGKDRFHDLKQDTPDSRGDDDYGVNPDTGDVIDQNGESIGNLEDEH